MTEATQQVRIRGRVPEADQDRNSFELKAWDGRKVTGTIDEANRDCIIAAFNKYSEHGQVLIQAIGRFDNQNRLVSLESIDSITELDPLDVPSRLDELRSLKDGWLDGEGKAPEPALLDWLSEKFDRDFPDALPLPHVYPTPEGGIQAEWSTSTREASLAIGPNRSAEWRDLNLEQGKSNAESLDLGSASGWDAAMQLIGALKVGVDA